MRFRNFIFLLQVVLGQYQTTCPSNTKRYCSGGKFFNEYSYEWFGGSDPKSMFGVFFKETITSTQSSMFAKTGSPTVGTPNSNKPLTKYEIKSYNMPGTLSGSTYQFLVNSVTNKKSLSVMRVRRIWQFPNPKSSYDETAGGTLPSTQWWWQVLYSWTEPGAATANSPTVYVAPVLGSYNQDWFLGDVVPFPSCAYIVRMVTSGTGASFTRFYTVEQMLFSVQYDTANQSRHAMVYSNKVTTQVKVGATTASVADDDLPINNEEISYFPGWCAFYWLTRGILILKVDQDCQSSWATNPDKNPCGTSTYLFPNPTSMKHFGYKVGTDVTDTATFIDSVFVYGFMYFSVVGNTQQVYKAQRISSTNGNIEVIKQWDLQTLSTARSLNPVMFPIFRMNSLDGYGYYITMSNTFNAGTIWQYVIYLKLDATGAKAIDATTGNYIEMSDNTFANLQQPQLLNPLRIANGVGNWNQRLYQTKGAMVDSRPLYMAWGGGDSSNYVANRNSLNLVSSVTNLYMTVSQTTSAPNAGIARPMDFYNYDLVVNSNQMFLMMPGLPTDDIGTAASINWDKNKVAIYDVITKDEVQRWQMHDCGDGIHNSTAFEVCDYAAISMDPASTSYVYPNIGLYPFYKTAGASGLPLRGIWYWPSTTSLGFPTGSPYPTRYGDNNYHICNTNCQDLPIETCGDGVQSNGPANTDGREVCDDGNQISGDGCSSDCKTIETGWECPVWGKPCNLLCGNGVLDPPYLRLMPDGTTQMFTEQCDLGSSLANAETAPPATSNPNNAPAATTPQKSWNPVWNYNNGFNHNFGTWALNEDAFDDPSAYQHACSSTCSISSRYYWACNTNTATAAVAGTGAANAALTVEKYTGGTAAVKPLSYCSYLCGNKWLDNIGQTDTSHAVSHALTEECDLLVQQYSGEKASGYTYNANLANVNLQTSPGPGTTTPQAWLTSSAFTQGTNPNWIWPFITPYVGASGTPGITNSYAYYDQRNIGCTELCKKRTANFKCPPSNLYDVGSQTIQQTNRGQAGSKPAINWTGPQLLCSDRIQDGVFDGAYTQILRSRQTPSIKTDSWQWNSYILYSTYNSGGGSTTMDGDDTYESTDTNDRIWAEQCDNNGDITHGCDVWGRIVTGWTCRHYYVAIRETAMVKEIEVPWFRSLCKETGTNLPAWRLLFQDDHSGFTSEGYITHEEAQLQREQVEEDDDQWGDDDDEDEYIMGVYHPRQDRGLNHDPKKAFAANLPTNTYPFRNHALSQNAKGGVNGQIRLAEDPASTDAQAIILSYPLTSTSTPDNVFVYYKTAACTAQVAPSYPGVPTAACTITSIQKALTAGVLEGKQRNTFGPYIVSNSGLQTLIWSGFQNAVWTANIYTTAVVPNIEFLGNFEPYYWGYLGIMLVRLSDGATFQVFRMTSTFDTVAANGNAVTESATTIQQTDMKLQFVVPGKVIVPPVFVNDIAAIYYKDAAGQGYLLFYKWSTYVDGMTLESTVTVSGDTNVSPVYQKYSLVRVATGVIFKVAGATTATFYKTSDYSYTATVVTFSAGSATVGDVSASAYQLLQPRDNPKNFAAATIPQIFGYQNNNYMYLLTWVESPPSLTVSTSIKLPCSAGFTPNTGGYACYDQMLTLSPEWIDVGYQSFVILSPINCAAKKGVTAITGMSARFYLLSTVPDIDANNDGIIDGTQTYTLGVLDAGSGTRVNYFKGWTCWDLPNYNQGTATSVTTFTTLPVAGTWTYT